MRSGTPWKARLETSKGDSKPNLIIMEERKAQEKT
jgi:hypothetical protein